VLTENRSSVGRIGRFRSMVGPHLPSLFRKLVSIGDHPAVAEARAAARGRQFERASALYAAFLERAPGHPRLWIQYGHALKELGRRSEAERAYRTAIGLAPHSVDGYRQLGHLLRPQDLNAAKREFLRGLAVEPTAQDLDGEIRALGGAGPADEVLAVLAVERATKLERRGSHGLASLLWAHVERARARKAARSRRWDAAIRSYSAALRAMPSLGAEHVQLGHALKESGALDQAVVAYRRAVAWDPHVAEAHRQLGFALKAVGEHERAEVALLTALRLHPAIGHVREELTGMGWTEHAIDNAIRRAWSVLPQDRTGEERQADNVTSGSPGLAEADLPPPPTLSSRERLLYIDLAHMTARS
jgi:tetratricopeptide (TPR) repeat protein